MAASVRSQLGPHRSAANEGQQLWIDEIRMRGAHAVRQAGNTLSVPVLSSFTASNDASAIGTIWSSSPCMTSTGLEMDLRSSVKSASRRNIVKVCDQGCSTRVKPQFAAEPARISCKSLQGLCVHSSSRGVHLVSTASGTLGRWRPWEVEAFPTQLGAVAPSTQMQALAAALFLYRQAPRYRSALAAR